MKLRHVALQSVIVGVLAGLCISAFSNNLDLRAELQTQQSVVAAQIQTIEHLTEMSDLQQRLLKQRTANLESALSANGEFVENEKSLLADIKTLTGYVEGWRNNYNEALKTNREFDEENAALHAENADLRAQIMKRQPNRLRTRKPLQKSPEQFNAPRGQVVIGLNGVLLD